VSDRFAQYCQSSSFLRVNSGLLAPQDILSARLKNDKVFHLMRVSRVQLPCFSGGALVSKVIADVPTNSRVRRVACADGS